MRGALLGEFTGTFMMMLLGDGVVAACVLAVSAALVYRLTSGGTNRSRLAGVTGGTADPVAVDPAWRNH